MLLKNPKRVENVIEMLFFVIMAEIPVLTNSRVTFKVQQQKPYRVHGLQQW
jgi:hypothetical protein